MVFFLCPFRLDCAGTLRWWGFLGVAFEAVRNCLGFFLLYLGGRSGHSGGLLWLSLLGVVFFSMKDCFLEVEQAVSRSVWYFLGASSRFRYLFFVRSLYLVKGKRSDVSFSVSHFYLCDLLGF